MSWTENDLLKMMHANSELFGDEITHIRDADDHYLIQYFEKTLASILDFYTFISSPYCVCKYGGKGDIEAANLRKDGFGLTAAQCAKIGNYIIGRWHLDHAFKKPRLDKLTTVVVLNYISLGYELDETCYHLKHEPCQPSSTADAVNAIRNAFSSVF